MTQRLTNDNVREESATARPDRPVALLVDVCDHTTLFDQAELNVVSIGGDALAATLEQLAPDIVIVGLNLQPETDNAVSGLSAVHTTRNSSQPQETPVIVLTRDAHSPQVERAYDSGATDVWMANAGPVILNQRLRLLINASQAFGELRRSTQKFERAQRIARFATWEWCFQSGRFQWSSELRRMLASFGPDASGIEALLEMTHPDERARVQMKVSEALKNQTSFCFDHRAVRGDGAELVLRQEADHVFDANGNVVGIEGFTIDITALKNAQVQIHSMANYDRLTGLPNRISFLDRVTHACERVERGRDSAAVALLDIDRFRDINDSLGHEVGNQLLCDVADRLAICLRKGDFIAREDDGMIARRGGDEFLVLLSDVEQAHHIAIAARRILESLSAPFRVAGKEIHVTGSIGIAVTDGSTSGAEELVRHAEIAMYDAKKSGGNSFQFFDTPMNRNVVERFALEGRLRRAMAREELILFYQPLVKPKTRVLVGAEALIRWNHPSKGLLSAEEFIPLAEETGLIVPIGRWVIRTACEQLSRWTAQGYPSLRLAVNVSPRELRAPGFIDYVAKLINESDIRPGQLEVEITERGVMHNDAPTLDILLHLRRLGVRLAVDDFGTGHTTFHYLKNFPLNTLKIDKSFTRGVAINGKDAAITKALVAMAHRLELNVVAEGVENEAQLSFLRDNHCDEVQGYLLGKPAPVHELDQSTQLHRIVSTPGSSENTNEDSVRTD